MFDLVVKHQQEKKAEPVVETLSELEEHTEESISVIEGFLNGVCTHSR